MYVHSKNTSAVLNDLGIYILSKIHKWPHMRAFKDIPKVYTTIPDGWKTDSWPEIKGAAADGEVVFPARPLITGGFLAYLGSLFRESSPRRATSGSAIPASVGWQSCATIAWSNALGPTIQTLCDPLYLVG